MPVKYVVGRWTVETENGLVTAKDVVDAWASYHQRIDDALDSAKREAELQGGIVNVLGMIENVNPVAHEIKWTLIYSIARHMSVGSPGHG